MTITNSIPNSENTIERIVEKTLDINDSAISVIFENFKKELEGLKGFNSKIGRSIKIELN